MVFFLNEPSLSSCGNIVSCHIETFVHFLDKVIENCCISCGEKFFSLSLFHIEIKHFFS